MLRLPCLRALILRALDVRRALVALGAAMLMVIAACAGSGDSTAPGDQPATARVALAATVGPVAQVAGAPVTLRITIAYLRTAGDSVPLGVQMVALSDAATQQVPVNVELATCLRDPGHRGADLSGVCLLRLDLALLQGETVLDHQVIEPVTARAGQTTSAGGQIALYTVARVTIVPPAGAPPGGPLAAVVGQTLALTASAVDASGQPVTSRSPTWTSDNPTVASVDSASGVVTARAAGRATITATVGGRTATIVVNVAPAPGAITVTGGGTGSGTVVSQPAGVNCVVTNGVATGTCSVTFPGNSTVTLTATPSTTSSFAGWTGACTSTALTCTVTLSQAQTVTATFVRQATLTLTVGGSGAGAVTATGAGVVGPGTCTLAAGNGSTTCPVAVQQGSAVTITVAPASGSTFGGWAGACASTTGTTCALTITGDVSVGAVFTVAPTLLTVGPTAGNAGAGTITSSDSTIRCAIGGSTTNGSCQAPFAVGANVLLRETPTQGQVFLGWGGACAASGTAPSCTVPISTATTVTAAFGPPQPLTLTLSGTGGGMVSAGEPCVVGTGAGPVTCTRAVIYNTVLTLVAVPDSASTFAGWTDACAGTSGTTCTVTLNQARTVGAIFQRRTATVTLAMLGQPGGIVQQNGTTVCTLPSTVTTTSCQVSVPVYTTVSFSAAPNAGGQFLGWSGLCSGTAPCTITVTNDGTLNAVFAPVTVRLTVSAGGENTGAGTITSNPAAINCALASGSVTGTCATDVASGSRVTLAASASANNAFAGWGGACASAGTNTTCVLSSVTSTTAVTASFVPSVYQLTLNLGSDGVASGTLTGPAPPGGVPLNCVYRPQGNPRQSGVCSNTYPAGTAVTLTATPDSGSAIDVWTAACAATPATSRSCTVAMTQAQTAGVNFTSRIIGVTAPSFVATTGVGRVTGTGGIDCAFSPRSVTSGTCSTIYPSGTQITYTAAPDANSIFAGWDASGTYCGGLTSFGCTFTAGRGGFAVAQFTAASTFELDAGDPNGNGTLLGTVTVRTAGRDSAVFQATVMNAQNPRFGYGNTVTLTATPTGNNRFVGWGGDCQAFGTAPTCTLTNYAPVPGNQTGAPRGQVLAYFGGPPS